MLIIYIFISYLLGSIPTGKIVGNFVGINLQKKGSGNIGFANAVRVLGWKLGLIVLAGDVSKGFLAIYLAAGSLSSLQLGFACIAVIVGNIYPVWLKFNGGKGIATGLGALLALDWRIAISAAIVYMLAFLVFRKSAYSSLTASASLPIIAYVNNKDLLTLCLVLCGIALYTHRSYLRIRVNKLRGVPSEF